MAGKWEQFKKDFNAGYERYDRPFDVNTVNRGNANILSDWNRVDAGPVEINGVPIQILLQQDRNLNEPPKSGSLFKTLDELRVFFKKHFLRDMDLEDSQKEFIVDQMMTFLHQGALQTPLSAAATMSINEKAKGNIAPNDAACNVVDLNGKVVNDKEGKPLKSQTRKLHFQATKDGFTVNEELTQNMMSYTINATKDINGIDNDDLSEEHIYPDDPKNKPYVYKANAEISVDFSRGLDSTKISVKKNIIDFGNQQVEKLLDDRNFLQKFVDGILVALGFKIIEKREKVEGAAAENISESQEHPDDGRAATP